MRKAQLTSFIVVGIILLVSIYLIFLADDEKISDTLDPQNKLKDTNNLFPLSDFIKYCMQKETTQIIREYSINSENLDPNNFIEYQNHSYIKLYSTKNYLLTPNKFKNKIKSPLISQLNYCINTTYYENEGFKVTTKNKTLDLQIQDDQVIIKLEFPIKLEKENQIIEENQFLTTIPIPLGKILKDTNDIINTELQRNFDLDYYRLNNPEFEIIKQSVYPTELYSISFNNPTSTNYVQFNFAIKNTDLTSEKYTSPEYVNIKPKSNGLGTCTINKICYDYTSENTCKLENGTFSLSNICPITNRVLDKDVLRNLLNKTTIIEQLTKPKSTCTKWFDITSGETISGTRFNGESWCSNEAGVGGRHYKLSCVNGNVIVEPCTDFKEDICAEETHQINTTLFEGQFLTAECRENRFQTCSDCATKDCCNNKLFKDCSWENNDTCIPMFPPGNKFWNIKTTSNICKDSKPSLLSCYSTGDCGSNYNYFGKFSGVNSDQIKKINNEIFAPLKTVSPTNPSFKLNQNFNKPYSFTSNFNSLLKNIDESLIFEINEYLNPINTINLQTTTSKCQPWIPTSSNCDKCNVFNSINGTIDYSYCTEYKCNSLGPNCVFEYQNGFPTCFLKQTDLPKLKIINIHVNNKTISSDNNILGDGVFLFEPILPNKKLDIKIQTNNPALCKLSFLPDKDFNDINSPDLTNLKYNKNHTLTIKLNNENQLISQIFDYFKTKNFETLLTTITDIRYEFETLKKILPNTPKYESGLYEIFVPLVNYYLDTAKKEKLKQIITDLKEDKYNLFIKCIDKSLKQSDDFHIKLSPQDPCTDTNKPKILKTIPEQNRKITSNLKIYLNKISECKYDIFDVGFTDMRYSFNCEKNPYNLNPIANGSYECNTIPPNDLISEKTTIYILCNDHPEYKTQNNTYKFTFNKNNKNNSFKNFNLTISNQSNSLQINATQLLQKEKEGNYTINLPDTATNYFELIFNEPFSCTDSKCSKTRCISKEDQIYCKRQVNNCTNLKQNKMEESYKLNLFKKTPLKILSAIFENNLFKTNVSDTKDSVVTCGIELNKDTGFFKMTKQNNTYAFQNNQITPGIYTSTIVCKNNYDETVSKKISYTII